MNTLNTYRGPTVIAEPDLRWPIFVLAAVITALLALSTAGLYYLAMTSDANSYTPPPHGQLIDGGN
jgi:hypothetical protein